MARGMEQKLIVKHICDHIIKPKIIAEATAPLAGKKICIPWIPTTPGTNIYPFHLTWREFPIRLAFAMTINKSQGQTLKKVGVLLTRTSLRPWTALRCTYTCWFRGRYQDLHGYKWRTPKRRIDSRAGFYSKYSLSWNNRIIQFEIQSVLITFLSLGQKNNINSDTFLVHM